MVAFIYDLYLRQMAKGPPKRLKMVQMMVALGSRVPLKTKAMSVRRIYNGEKIPRMER